MEVADKLKSRTPKEREFYFSELRWILEMRDEAARYGITGDDFVNLPDNVVISAGEKLYQNLFENKYKD